MKKKIILILLLLFPFKTFAYSDKIIVSGETIGIEAHSNGVYIVGFYNVNNKNIAKEAGFQIGDIIKSVNNKEIENIDDLNDIISEENEYNFEIIRNNINKIITIRLTEENNIIKTGLFVKDRVNGIGTLSYIDPKTKIYGSLGHEILESTSFTKFNLKNGKIYKASVTTIKKSENGQAGEKNAKIDKSEQYGHINKNEIDGIYGIYEKDINEQELMEVGKKEEIKKGKALIKTVINENEIEDFTINIISIDENDYTKNIFFEITDKKLLEKAGGIVQGMSGSPIIQNNKIIGVVNYVIVNEASKGYGIFITTMLEEGDKILS